jgi:diacylglycerol O-acyltransferase / trehalose O-mycolyltransferase
MGLTLALLGAAQPSPADAGRVVTWKTHSRHVNPGEVEFGRPPICAKCTPHPRDGLYVNVWLPDGYNGTRRFPVLYLLHGGDGQYDFWRQSPRENDPRGTIVPDLVRDFPGIVVMPDGGADGHYMNWWSGGRRGDPGWERYHLEELIPLVERRLRVRRGRRFHAVAGFSLGGYGAAFYASQRPGYFGIAAALSARLSLRDPFFYGQLDYALGDPSRQRFYWTGHDPLALVRNLRWTRLYVSAGDGQALPGEPSGPANVIGEQNLRRLSERFARAARRAHVPVTYRLQRGAHTYDLGWRSFQAAFRWIEGSFGRPLPEEPARWSYKTVAQRSDAFGFRISFAKPPKRVASFSRKACTLQGRGAGRVVVRSPRGARSLRARLPFRRRIC